MESLVELDLIENTLVVYLSDHGDLMGDHWLQQKGPFHFDGLIRVPFIWSWPDHIELDVVNKDVVRLLDFAPTIMDLCGAPIPEGLRPVEPFLPLELPAWPGHSLCPSLEGRQPVVREAAFIYYDED